MVNQRPVKIYKHFSIENKSIAIGCRQKKVNSKIGRCLGCGVDAIGWLSLKNTYAVCIYNTVYRVIFFIAVAFLFAYTVPNQ